MAGQKPRPGWVYWVNPDRIILKCSLGHSYLYELPQPDNLICKDDSCNLKLDPSSFLRGICPYIVWRSAKFDDIETFIVIPLSSREFYKGLPTAYPIKATLKNGLPRKGCALIQQLIQLDIACFRDINGDWKPRIGQLDKNEKNGIAERLKYLLELSQENLKDTYLNYDLLGLKELMFANLEAIAIQDKLSDI